MKALKMSIKMTSNSTKQKTQFLKIMHFGGTEASESDPCQVLDLHEMAQRLAPIFHDKCKMAATAASDFYQFSAKN